MAELAQAAGVQRLLFVSATSVWAPGQEEDEHPMPAHERGMRMLASEQAAMGAGIPCAMVLRPAGLYGPQRHPGRFLAGKTLEGGGQAVNLEKYDERLENFTTERQQQGGGKQKFQGRNAQRQTGEEDAEAREPAAKLAQRQPQGERRPHSAAAAVVAVSISPSRSGTIRSQRAATSGA